MTLPVQLPDQGDGSRRRLRRQAARRRRRRVGAVMGLLAAAGVVAATLLVGGDSGGDGSGTAAGPAREPLAERSGETALVVFRDGQGALVGVSLLALGASGSGGSVVHVPAGLLVETPAGLVALRDAAREGDPMVVALVANAVGAAPDSVTVLDPRRLAEAIGPAGPLQIELAEGGSDTVAPSALSSFLEAPAPTDLARLVRFQAFWTAWLEAVAGGVGDPDEELLGRTATVIGSLASGETGHDVLPVTAVQGPGGAQQYQLSGADLDALLARVVPDVAAYTSRPTVAILDGSGAAAAVPSAILRIVGAGGRVTLVGRADPSPQPASTVAFRLEARRAAAGRVAKAVGAGRIERGTGADVADLTVVLGEDFEPETVVPERGASAAGT